MGAVKFSSPGSLNNTDPKLGAFGDHGGLTPTLPLLPDSPAIDRGSTKNAPAFDQRGYLRPYGVQCEIGAFEYYPEGVIPPNLALRLECPILADGQILLQWSGPALLQYADEIRGPWQDLLTTNGHYATPPEGMSRFFRLRSR